MFFLQGDPMNIKKGYACLLLLISGITCSVSGQGIIIPPGIYVTLREGNLLIFQNWTNNGTFNQESGLVWFNGFEQIWGGSTPQMFKNVIIGSTSQTVISAPGQSLKETLLCNGLLDAVGNLTLLSDSQTTALIDGSGAGNVIGLLTMQRYLPSAFGYKYFSSPFQAATVGEFGDDMDLGAAFPTFYWYDEGLTYSGWRNYTEPSGVLFPMTGYAVNFGPDPDPATADVSGEVSNGYLGPFFLFNNNNPYTLGFNLVGNPYPSPIDWDAPEGWERKSIDNALYYFNAGTTDQYTGTYSTYIDGISSDTIASNIIASMQGFFIHVTDGEYPVEGILEISNEARVNTLTPVFHKTHMGETRPLIRIAARFDDLVPASDPAVIYFSEEATTAFDNRCDALKLMNTDPGVPNLYSFSPDGRRLSINGLPDVFDTTLTIPLGLSIRSDGLVIIEAIDILRIPADLNIYLKDDAGHRVCDLIREPAFYVSLGKGEYENRFSLIFSRSEIVPSAGSADHLSVYTSGQRIHGCLTENVNMPGEFSLYSVIGKKLFSQPLGGTGYCDLPSRIPTGIYVATYSCSAGVFSDKIYISGR
jgi:hypothetical protein